MYSNFSRNRLSANETFNKEYSPSEDYDRAPLLPPPPLPPLSQSSYSRNYQGSPHIGNMQSSSRNNAWDYKEQEGFQGHSYSHDEGQLYREEIHHEVQSHVERDPSDRPLLSGRNFPPEQTYLERNQPQRQGFSERNRTQGQSMYDRHPQGYLERNQGQSMAERSQSQGQGCDVQGGYPERDEYSGTGYSQAQESSDYSDRNYLQAQDYSEPNYATGQETSETDHTQAQTYSNRNPYQEQQYADYTGTQENYQEQTYQDYNYNQDTSNPQNYDNSGYSNTPYTDSSTAYDSMQESYSQGNVYTEGGEASVEPNYENGANEEHESPLKDVETKKTVSDESNLPKTFFSKKVVNIFDRKTEIPDHRRPPPVKIDPNIPSDIAALFKTNICQLCNVKLNSRVQAKTHYEGKPHAKKVKTTMEKRFGKTSTGDEDSSDAEPSVSKKSKKNETSPSEPPKKKKAVTDGTQLYCKCCDLSFTSTDHATQHYLGRNHHRVLHGLKPLKPGYFNNETGKWQRSPTDPITPTERLPTPLDAEGNEESEEGKEKGSFFCNLCGVAATSPEQLEGHMNGVRHKRIEQIKNKKKKPGSDSILASVIKEKTNRKPKSFNKPKDFSIYRTPSGKFYCSPCDLTLNSELQFAQHVESKKHKIRKK